MSKFSFALSALLFTACTGSFKLHTPGGSSSSAPPASQPQPAAASQPQQAPTPVAATAQPAAASAPPAKAAPSSADIETLTKPISVALHDLSWLELVEDKGLESNGSHDQSPVFVADANACTAAAAAARDAGVPADTAILSTATIGKMWTTSLADAPAKCAQLLDQGGSFDKRVEAAHAAANAEIAAPYKKAGIDGDKLHLLVSHDGNAFFGVGGNELETPAQLAKASLIFETSTSANDGTHLLRRWQFRGNVQVGVTEQSFLASPPASAFR